MKRSMVAVTVALVVVGCGKKADDAQNAVSAMAAAATAAPKLEAGLKEAEQFQKDRAAKGDTVAMPYVELQKQLPTTGSGPPRSMFPTPADGKSLTRTPRTPRSPRSPGIGS